MSMCIYCIYTALHCVAKIIDEEKKKLNINIVYICAHTCDLRGPLTDDVPDSELKHSRYFKINYSFNL